MVRLSATLILMQSLKKQLIRLAVGVGLLFVGAVVAVIGLLVALVIDANWLTLCIVGLLMAIIGIILIVREIRRLGGTFNNSISELLQGKLPRK